jgi:hypothetical protein
LLKRITFHSSLGTALGCSLYGFDFDTFELICTKLISFFSLLLAGSIHGGICEAFVGLFSLTFLAAISWQTILAVLS